MKLRDVFILLVLVFTTFSVIGCVKEEGPAERIGRSIDDLSKGLQDLDKPATEEELRQRTRDLDARERRLKAAEENLYRDQSSCNCKQYEYDDHGSRGRDRRY